MKTFMTPSIEELNIKATAFGKDEPILEDSEWVVSDTVEGWERYAGTKNASL